MSSGWNIVPKGQNQLMCRTMFFPVNKANVPHSFLKFLYEQIRRKWPDKCILQDDNTPQHTATHHNTPQHTTIHLTHNPFDSGNS